MNKMSGYSVIALSLIIATLTKCANSDSKKKIIAINVTYDLPLTNWDTAAKDETTTYDVFYFDDLTMFKFNYYFDSLVNGRQMLEETRKMFFVYSKDSLFGEAYYTDPPHSAPHGRLPVDSVLEKNAIVKTQFDLLAGSKPDTSYIDSEDNAVYVYHPPIRQGDYTPYSIYLYYSKNMTGIPATFSAKMDTLEGMKLIRIRVLPDRYFKKGFPKKEISYEMKQISIDDSIYISGLFNRYRQTHS